MATPKAVDQARLDLQEIREALDAEVDLSMETDLDNALDRMVAFVTEQDERGEDHANKLSFRYGDGKRARIGDRVQITGSSRYGTATGVTVGAANNAFDGKTRVTVRLDNGRNDSYTPSVGRVTRVEKAVAAVA